MLFKENDGVVDFGYLLEFIGRVRRDSYRARDGRPVPEYAWSRRGILELSGERPPSHLAFAVVLDVLSL